MILLHTSFKVTSYFYLKKKHNCRYLTDLTDLFYWKFFLQPIVLMYSVTVCIFAYLVVSIDWVFLWWMCFSSNKYETIHFKCLIFLTAWYQYWCGFCSLLLCTANNLMRCGVGCWRSGRYNNKYFCEFIWKCLKLQLWSSIHRTVQFWMHLINSRFICYHERNRNY